MSVYSEPRFLPSGESCLVVEFADEISREANVRLQNLRRVLEAKNIPGVRELVATYRSLSVYVDPLALRVEEVRPLIESLLSGPGTQAEEGRRVVVLPVCYGGEHGPDMDSVARHTGLDPAEVVRRHTANDCYCFMLGFTPGFPYLGGMDEKLETPRLKEPRTLIPPGSVGIAGKQTGVYSVASPGGWQLIGRTPVILYNPAKKDSPCLLEAGEWVRFRAVAEDEYKAVAAAEAAGTYVPERFEIPAGKGGAR